MVIGVQVTFALDSDTNKDPRQSNRSSLVMNQDSPSGSMPQDTAPNSSLVLYGEGNDRHVPSLLSGAKRIFSDQRSGSLIGI